jgi:hypothetical protein
MTEAELQELHPPRRCGDGSSCRTPGGGSALLYARLSELAFKVSYGWEPGAIYECVACGWKRAERLKSPPRLPGHPA